MSDGSRGNLSLPECVYVIDSALGKVQINDFPMNYSAAAAVCSDGLILAPLNTRSLIDEVTRQLVSCLDTEELTLVRDRGRQSWALGLKTKHGRGAWSNSHPFNATQFSLYSRLPSLGGVCEQTLLSNDGGGEGGGKLTSRSCGGKYPSLCLTLTEENEPLAAVVEGAASDGDLQGWLVVRCCCCCCCCCCCYCCC